AAEQRLSPFFKRSPFRPDHEGKPALPCFLSDKATGISDLSRPVPYPDQYREDRLERFQQGKRTRSRSCTGGLFARRNWHVPIVEPESNETGRQADAPRQPGGGGARSASLPDGAIPYLDYAGLAQPHGPVVGRIDGQLFSGRRSGAL